MKIFVFGNPDLAGDNMALRILPKLQKKFPLIQFIHKDPLENWTLGNGEPSGRRLNDRQICDQKPEKEKIIIIDAVKGISKVTVFDGLENFTAAHKRMTMHDFDLYDELALLQKLKKLPKVAIIGIPWGESEKDIWNDLLKTIQSISL